MASTVLICKLKMIQFTSLLYPRQPVFDNNVGTAMEYFTHFLLAGPAGRFLNEQSLAYHFGEVLNLDWLHDDFHRNSMSIGCALTLVFIPRTVKRSEGGWRGLFKIADILFVPPTIES